MKRIFLVDGNSLANRAFYAMPYFTNSKGEPSGAVFGFANLIIKLITEEKPDGIVVAFDHARKTFRNDIFADYKGNRKATPEELTKQFPIIKEMLSKLGITIYEEAGIEADDIIGTLSKNIKDAKKVIISGDRDLLQLIDDNTEVWLTKKGLTELQKLDTGELLKEFSIKPFQVIEMKALMGDSSDNIPGVSGIGEKTALKLVCDYGDLDNIYKNIDDLTKGLQDKLVSNKEMAYISKDLATIRCDENVEIKSTDYKFPFKKEAYNFFKEWSFASLIKRKNLFEDIEGFEEENVVAKKIKLENLDMVKNLAKKTKDYFAYNLSKMEFSVDSGEIYYLSQVVDMFNDYLNFDDVFDILKPIFENEKILKITYSAKKDMKSLKGYGIKLKSFFDLEISKYLLFAGIKANEEEKNVNEYHTQMKKDIEKIKEYGLENLLYNCEFPLVEVLFEMEEDGFKLNEEVLASLDKEYSDLLANLEEEIKKLAGEDFNLSSPKQMSYILFDKLGLYSYNNKKKSTSAEYLQEMIDQHEIIEKILLFRKVSKIKNTYIDVYKNLCQTKGSVIHTVFNQTLTSTGRLSSSDPNLQNIPTKDDLGRNLRKMFVSKFENGKIISADYNQIELRLLAAMSNEEELIKAYQNGEDIHAKTASQIFNVDIKDVTPLQRREAKAVNFGVIYGISDYGLAQNIKTSRKRAKAYIDSYFIRYPKVKEFSNKNIEYARYNGYVKTLFGRIRHIPEIQSSNFNTRGFAERVAMNMPLQGTASDIIKFAMIKVFEKLKGLKSQLILQIHDELIIDVYPGEEEKVKEILKSVMENIVSLSVNLPVSIGEGKSLFECK